jgi:hypothetical protein
VLFAPTERNSLFTDHEAAFQNPFESAAAQPCRTAWLSIVIKRVASGYRLKRLIQLTKKGRKH